MRVAQVCSCILYWLYSHRATEYKNASAGARLSPAWVALHFSADGEIA